MKEDGSLICEKVKEFTSISLEIYMKEYGIKTSVRELAKLYSEIKWFIQENLTKTEQKEEGNTSIGKEISSQL